MKKYLSILCASFFALTMTVSFSSCSKEDDDLGINTPEQPTGGQEQGGSGNDHPTTGKGYVEPCLQWGANGEEIKSWMKKHTQGFNTTIDQPLSLTFTCYKPYVQIAYALVDPEKPGLMMATVSYFECTDPLSILENVEKSYNCKITAEPYAENRYFAEDVVINSKKTDITAVLLGTIFSIQFKLDE